MMTIKNRKRKGKIKVEFSSSDISPYSGLVPIMEFIQRLNLAALIESEFEIGHGKNVQYSDSQILKLVLLAILSGEDRIQKIENFSRDKLVQQLLELPGKIDANTISRRISQMGEQNIEHLQRLMQRLSKKIHYSARTRYHDILDIDSTVITVYGNQEGSALGYNPEHRGKKSFHPLLIFLESSRECVGSIFRAGDAHTSSGSVELLHSVMNNVLQYRKRLLVRGDSGFFSGELFKMLEEYGERVCYIIKARLKNFQEIIGYQGFSPLPGNPEIEYKEILYQASGWEKSRRLIVFRKIEKVLRKQEGFLFDIPLYTYWGYLTNTDYSADNIEKIYRKRGTCENYISMIKSQVYGGKLRVQAWSGSEMFWHISNLAYNIYMWLRYLFKDSGWNEEIATFRAWFISVPCKIIRHARQTIIKVYRYYYEKERWLFLYQKILRYEFLCAG